MKWDSVGFDEWCAHTDDFSFVIEGERNWVGLRQHHVRVITDKNRAHATHSTQLLSDAKEWAEVWLDNTLCELTKKESE